MRSCKKRSVKSWKIMENPWIILNCENKWELIMTKIFQQRRFLRWPTMKQFSKLRFMEFVGLLNSRFDYASLDFEPSARLRFKSYVKLFLYVTLGLKFFLSQFFPRESTVQLLIGSLYNFLEPKPKFFIGLIVSNTFTYRLFSKSFNPKFEFSRGFW